jgi:hypothetical protein
VLYLVLEEAHEFAPKERAGFDKENLALHYAKKFATAGRSKGIRLIVATQRTQALHNALLGSCETMIVHRLTAPADQEPVLKWLKANVNDKARQEEIAGGISSLKTGEGWLCSGEAKIFERIQFPRIHTFDNSATPTHDGAEVKVTAANIDFDKLHALIGTAISEAEANDPKLLKARIRELEAAAAKRSPAADPADNAELRVLRRKVEDFERRVDELTLYGEHMFAAAAQTQAISDELEEKTRAIRAVRWPRQPKAVQPSAPGTPPGDNPAPARVIPTPAPRPSTNGSGEHGLGKPQFNVLRALYWLRSEERTVAKVAFYADYSPTSSSYEKALSGLRSAGLVQGWSITSDGERLISAHAGEKPGREQLVFWLRDKLDGPQLAIFDALLAARGRRMKAEELAPASDYSVTSSSFEKALSKLRSIGAADGYEKDGGARAAAVFFE